MGGMVNSAIGKRQLRTPFTVHCSPFTVHGNRYHVAMTPPESVTDPLSRWQEGDGEAFEHLMPIVYDELRRLADFLSAPAREPYAPADSGGA
jgi:hypothetical protein